MWPFTRKQHPLPKFPPSIRDFFFQLCTDVPLEKLPELNQEFFTLKTEIMKEGKDNPLYDRKLSEKIFAMCDVLLDFYPSASTYQRKIIVGALKYCIAKNDGMSDEFFASGLRDDAKIVNFVLEEIGKGDQAIILS